MKKLLFIISVSLIMLSCQHTGNNSTTHDQNVNVRISESSGGWEYLEAVEVARPMSERAKQDIHPGSSGALLSTMYVYIRVVAGEKYFGITSNRNNSPKVASDNPYYNDGTSWGKYQYRIKYEGTYYFFNL